MNQQRAHRFDGLSLVMDDQHGRVLSRFDLSRAEIPEKLAKELLRALISEFGHTALETHRQTFRGIRKFALMLREKGLNRALPLPASIAMDWHLWLAESGLAGSTAQSHQNNILAILKWCARNSSGVLPARASFVVPTFQRQDPKQRPALSEKDVRGVLSAAYAEIQEVESRRAIGVRLLQGAARTPSEEHLRDLIEDLMLLGKGRIASLAAVTRAGKRLRRRVKEVGGLKEVLDLVYVDPRSMFPFYLAIICQTGGNPSSIAMMRTDCVSPDPLRSDVETLTWDKKRAGAEQRNSFPRGKEWSAPSLVRRYLAITEHMRASVASGYHRDHLFIAVPRVGPRAAKVPCPQLLHNLLDKFIERHKLAPFDFKDLRAHVAQAHRKAGGSVLDAKRKLNHRHSRTTERYLNPSEVEPDHDLYIHRYQGQLVSFTRTPVDPLNGAAGAAAASTGPSTKAAATVFGFDCADPYSGIAGHSKKGSLCTHFAKCSTCPGAIVQVDDPKVVATLLASKQALEAAKLRSFNEGWVARFNELYQPTLTVLDEEILPYVSNEVQKKALELVRVRNIPVLE